MRIEPGPTCDPVWCLLDWANHRMEFFLNVSLNLLNSLTKIFVITIKGLKPTASCVRDQDAITVPPRHMWDTGSLNWPKFMLKWFIRFSEFAEFTVFNESSTPFKKNSNGLTDVCIYLNGVFKRCVLAWWSLPWHQRNFWTRSEHLMKTRKYYQLHNAFFTDTR